MYILIIIAMSCNVIASDSPILLGQSPRSAQIFNVEPIGTNSWWIAAGVHPSTMIPKSMGYGSETRDHDWILATTYMFSAGMTHRFHKHLDIYSSIGALVNAEQVYIPIQFEARAYPFRKRVRPYIALGIGGMISNEFILYGTRGFGINAKMSEDITFDIQYKHMRGDVFLFAPYNAPHMQFSQRGVQATIFMNI
ncbi:MAG: hypothetical protein RL734_1365 [Bacteroidota bacterium]|jgi:hypothetical protein